MTNRAVPVPASPAGRNLPALEPEIVFRIREALADVGDFGEITLVVLKGKVKFIQVMQSRCLTGRPGAAPCPAEEED